MIDNCHICISNKDLEANLLSTDYWHVILLPDQGYLGRAYVALRDHKVTLSDLSMRSGRIMQASSNAWKTPARSVN